MKGGFLGHKLGRVIDEYNGLTTKVHVEDGNTIMSQTQDVNAILDNNQRLRESGDGYNPARDMRRVASVPIALLLTWLRTDGINPTHYMRNRKAYAKWLERKIYDKDNEFVLTAPHFRNPGKRSNGVTVPKVDSLSDALTAGRKLGV